MKSVTFAGSFPICDTVTEEIFVVPLEEPLSDRNSGYDDTNKILWRFHESSLSPSWVSSPSPLSSSLSSSSSSKDDLASTRESLVTESRHYAITGGTGGCQNCNIIVVVNCGTFKLHEYFFILFNFNHDHHHHYHRHRHHNHHHLLHDCIIITIITISYMTKDDLITTRDIVNHW